MLDRRHLRPLGAILFVLAAIPLAGHLLTRGALWADEAALALNIGPRGLFEMGRPFVFYQACPWGTMALVKLTVRLFGSEEASYRLVPFLAALGSLVPTMAVAAYSTALTFGGRATFFSGLVAIALLGASADVVYYAAELKPYTMDMLVTAVLLRFFLRVLTSAGPARRDWAKLAAAGVVAGWLSMPSIFVTGALTAALLYEGLRRGWSRRSLAGIVGMGALWLGSFALHFSIFIQQSDLATKPVVRNYWRNAFAPFPPTSVADLRWYAGKFLYLFDAPVDVDVPAFGAALFLVGAGVLVRRRPGLAIALLGPWALALVASMLGRYPPEGRLAMFLVPPVVTVLALVLGRGFADERASIRVATGLALGLLVLPGLPRVADHVTPGPKQDMRALLSDLGAAHQGDAPVFLSDWDFEQIWQFYAPALGLPDGVHFRIRWLRETDAAGTYPKRDALAERTFGRPRVWVVAHEADFGYEPNAPSRSETPMATFIDRFYLDHGGRRIESRTYGDLRLRAYDLSDAVP